MTYWDAITLTGLECVHVWGFTHVSLIDLQLLDSFWDLTKHRVRSKALHLLEKSVGIEVGNVEIFTQLREVKLVLL